MEIEQNQHSSTESHTEPYSFSTPLKIRLVDYFRRNYDLDVKDEEADLFLNSLAALYGALADAAKTGAEPTTHERGRLGCSGRWRAGKGSYRLDNLTQN